MWKEFNSENALIFRIIHRDNLPWLTKNGLHCATSNKTDPNFVSIGNADLISKRHTRVVKIPPGGTLSDYVPFYFTPFSPMAYNINTGYNGIRQRKKSEILILSTSLHKLKDNNIAFLFTDRHAYLEAASFSSNIDDLGKIDWKILQNKDFKRDYNDLGKMERYQAEALVHKHMPLSALIEIGCYDDLVVEGVNIALDQAGFKSGPVGTPKREWYF